MQPDSIVGDGPCLGPFSSFMDYIRQHIDWGICNITSDARLQPHTHLLPLLETFRDEFLPRFQVFGYGSYYKLKIEAMRVQSIAI